MEIFAPKEIFGRSGAVLARTRMSILNGLDLALQVQQVARIFVAAADANDYSNRAAKRMNREPMSSITDTQLNGVDTPHSVRV